MKYNLVENYPVARFWYKGTHTHPVRRTVLVTESTKTHLSGYELRDGNIVRQTINAPVKTYIRKKIAKGRNLRARQKSVINLSKTTLVRKSLMSLIESGI